MAGLTLLSLIALVVRRQFPGGRSTWIALALVSTILVGAADSGPAMWDDFWNWLPSAAYAYRRDSLPWPDLAPSFSIFAGYPQGMPLMIAGASFIDGRFIETAGPTINVALLAASSTLFAEAIAAPSWRCVTLRSCHREPRRSFLACWGRQSSSLHCGAGT